MAEDERAELDEILIQVMPRMEALPAGDRAYFGGRLFRMAKELLPADAWPLVSRVLQDAPPPPDGR
jgi:hypothetical protein